MLGCAMHHATQAQSDFGNDQCLIAVEVHAAIIVIRSEVSPKVKCLSPLSSRTADSLRGYRRRVDAAAKSHKVPPWGRPSLGKGEGLPNNTTKVATQPRARIC